MKDFKCPICGGPTEKIWENVTKTKYGMRCTKGHQKTGGKSGDSIEYPTILVPREELVK
ncbi:MAG TPA: hypothetical protein VF350_05135 [Candidatus Bathyarchaeia archaeon]